MRHAVMALFQQVQERPSGLPGGGTQGYDLSLNRHKELVHEEVEHRPPLEILAELRAIEQEILQGIEELEGMLGMSQDANQAAQARNSGLQTPKRPTTEESRRRLEAQVWTVPLLDDRSADEILGDDDEALC